MSNRRNVGVGMILTAAVALVLSTVAAIGAPAQAAPGDATITATPNSGLSDLQVISVSGNAGPLSTVLRGPAREPDERQAARQVPGAARVNVPQAADRLELRHRPVELRQPGHDKP